MIPLRDVIPSRTTPVVTIALIAVNAGALRLYDRRDPRALLPRVWFLMPLMNGLDSVVAATAGEPVGGIAFRAHIAGFSAALGAIHSSRFSLLSSCSGSGSRFRFTFEAR